MILLAGAGFAKWAAGLPLARELFDFNIDPFGRREQTQLKYVRDLKNSWDAENPSGLAEEFVSCALNREPRSAAAVRWYVVRRLSEPYIWREWHAGKWRRHVLMVDENRKWERPGVKAVRRYLDQLAAVGLSGIVTPNYDLLFEYALGSGGFNYGIPGERLHGRGPYPVSQWRNPVVLRGSLPIAKIHGSISWDEEGRYTDGRRGLSGKALIVAPGHAKGAPESLAREWELAATLLRAARRVVVFGFAFNPYDKALLEHLALNGGSIEEVRLIDVAPNLVAAQRIWPRAQVRGEAPAQLAEVMDNSCFCLPQKAAERT